MDIKKGQEVWFWSDVRGVSRSVVTSVGHKYITIEQSNLKFNKDDLKEVNYRGHASFIIPDIDEYYNQMKLNRIKQKLYRYDWYKLEDEKIEIIYDLIKDLI